MESTATFGGVVLLYLPGIGQMYWLLDYFPCSWRSVTLSWKYQPLMNEDLRPRLVLNTDDGDD